VRIGMPKATDVDETRLVLCLEESEQRTITKQQCEGAGMSATPACVSHARGPAPRPRSYRSRRPERTVLYSIVQHHLESWHNNHHAFPASAKHGLYPGQIDIGWHFVQLLERFGLGWDVQLPGTLPPRVGITAVREGAEYVLQKRAVVGL